MSRFIQLHILTSYPPANLNRDDLGRPKTAVMGGELRLRISSQSVKRAWRVSDVFQEELGDHLGVRTKEMGVRVYRELINESVKEAKALDIAKKIAAQFGKLKSPSDHNSDELTDKQKEKIKLERLCIEQLAHISTREQRLIDELIEKIASDESYSIDEELVLLRREHTSVDIALFGRMLASSPQYNTEAAAQVAHAISVHSVAVEDDYFTAVDDLNFVGDDVGAAHLGEIEFAAGLFYLYVCVDKQLLLENLTNDEMLVNKTLAALIECIATVGPTGKQNSFASRSRASYILCETGSQQPRSLSVAFLKSITQGDMLNDSINRIEQTVDNMDKVYGACADVRRSMNTLTAEGTLESIKQCAVEA